MSLASLPWTEFEFAPQHPLVLVLAGLFGLLVGSFLNVAIHRLPLESESVAKPQRSYCPSCKATLSWRENLPLLSWLIQLGRCRHCGRGISLRYPLVEALNAGLWVLAAWRLPEAAWLLLLVQCAVLSGLVVATFVDFACFEIPDQISLGGILLAPVAALLVPGLHQDSPVAQAMSAGWSAGQHVERFGALVSCALGMVVGGGLLLAIGKLGKLVFKRDAMGLGDVKLLCAGGGFVGAGGALGALMIAALCASVAGLANMLRFAWLSYSRARSRGNPKPFGRSLAVGRSAGRYLPFGPYLALGIGIALLAWNDVLALLR